LSPRGLVLVNQRLEGLNGADLIGKEILRALWATSHPLTVVSWHHWSPEREANNEPRRVKWMTPPVSLSFPTFDSTRSARRAAAWLFHTTLDIGRAGRLRLAPRALTVVNGFDNVFGSFCRKSPAATPSVLVVHDSPSKYNLQDQRPIEWALHKMAGFSHYIFPSMRVYEEWLNFEPVGSRPGMVIPNCCRENGVAAVRAQDRRTLRSRLEWPPDRVVVLCLGSVQFRKGQDLLVKALARVVATIPNVLLALVGGEESDADRSFGRTVRSEVETSGLRRHVRFLGPREDALECIYAADILAVPSRSEVMPLTILEAMALETPVVASAVGGIPELIEDGQTGRLVPSEDPEKLAAALLLMANDAHGRRSLAVAARERYWSRFSRERFAARYVAGLETLLRGEEWS
jgi:glycosyltransferase involved in cell wall biosynthesis